MLGLHVESDLLVGGHPAIDNKLNVKDPFRGAAYRGLCSDGEAMVKKNPPL